MDQSVLARWGAISNNFKRASTLFLFVIIIALPGCGSTKVYTADKTLVHGSNLYNLSKVGRLGSRVDGTLPNGEAVDLERLDKKAINALLGEHSTLLVTTAVEMDDQEFIYQNVRVKNYAAYSKVVKNQESAMNKIKKFMANKKSTQLKLKQSQHNKVALNKRYKATTEINLPQVLFRMPPAHFSAIIMTGALVFPDTSVGITDASTTRN